MTAIDDALRASERYAEHFTHGDLAAPPARGLAVLTCMDARINVEALLGLQPGDAHIIRNAGGIVTEDTLRSLIISHHMLQTREFMVINHVDCGLLSFRDEDLHTRLREETGAAAVAPATFHTFTDVEDNVRLQLERLRAHPWVPDRVSLRGFIYDIHTGRLREVQ